MEADAKKMKQMLGTSGPFCKSDEDGSPIYFQLAKRIRRQIEKGNLTNADLIPSERQIAAYNNLSLATVRKALDELVNRGFLKRVQGKGTFVTGTRDRRDKIRFYPLVEGFDSKDPVFSVQVKEIKKIKGFTRINQHLGIKDKSELIELRRILLYRGTPLIYCVSYLPENLFPGLETFDTKSFGNQALYYFLEEKFGVTTISHTELLSATAADKNIAGILNIQLGHPILMVEKKVFTHKDKPYEYRISHCMTDTLKLIRTI